jgi:hypothetical protein
MAKSVQKCGLITNQGQFFDSAPPFELAFTLNRQRDRERAFNVDQSRIWMIAGKLCALRSTVFGKTFRYVASASDADCAVRASEDVDEGVSADRCRRFSRWEMPKVVALGHVRWGLF